MQKLPQRNLVELERHGYRVFLFLNPANLQQDFEHSLADLQLALSFLNSTAEIRNIFKLADMLLS